MLQKLKSSILYLFLPLYVVAADETQLDKGLEIESVRNYDHTVFEDIVSVQRRAKVKKNKMLFQTYFSMDFSDATYTMYSTNLAFGYGVSESWEVYLTYAPMFITNERRYSKLVRGLQLAGNYSVSIEAPKARSFMGVEVVWAPLYGKDSFGEYGVIRSDTFVNLAYGKIDYVSPRPDAIAFTNAIESQNFYKSKLMLGKTFFIRDLFNLRLMAGGAFIETLNDVKKDILTVGLIETGVVFYF
jgi:hypothetical protein